MASVDDLLAQARVRVSSFMTKQQQVIRRINSQSASFARTLKDQDQAIRFLAAPTFFESSLRDALFSTYIFEVGFDKIFTSSTPLAAGSEKRAGLLQLIHILADSIPIDLFNADQIIAGTEIPTALGIAAADLHRVFVTSFPNTKEARDAVAHYHDRAFGRYCNRQILQTIGDSRIFRYGKKFLDDKGNEFYFRFEEKNFADYFTSLSTMLT